MTDKEFLSWVYDRMIYKYGENENVDYLHRFKRIIDSLQDEPEPQFKVGDIIRSKVWERAVHEIVSMDDSAYYFENGGMVRFDDQELWELVEEPVSEDSKKGLPKIWDRETLDEYAYQVAYDLSNDWMRETATWDDVETAVKLGAKWQEERKENG